MKFWRNLTLLLTLPWLFACQDEEFAPAEQQTGGTPPAPQEQDPAKRPKGPDQESAERGPASDAGPADDGDGDQVSCNPFGVEEQSANPPGVKARLKVLKEGARTPHKNRLPTYYDPNVAMDAGAQVFFPKIHVPERAWDAGFLDPKGNPLRHPLNNEEVFEWFSLDFQGHLVPGDNFSDGHFQVVALSDDGMDLTVDGEKILSSPKHHPPTGICGLGADGLVLLKEKRPARFRLRYFQGPRYHIAITLFVRPVHSLDDLPQQEAQFRHLCGKRWIKERQLLEAGFQVADPSMFIPAERAEDNPCQPQEL